MNDEGAVAGRLKADKDELPAVWRSGRVTRLPLPGGALSGDAMAINNKGNVVGLVVAPSSMSRASSPSLADALTSMHAVLWRNGRVMDLNDEMPKGSGWTLITAQRINDRGQIAGEGVVNGQQHGYLLTPAVRISRPGPR